MTRRWLCLLAALSTFFLVGEAQAQTAYIGTDGRCVYVVPNHSKVKSETGDVYDKDNNLIGNNITECAALSASGTPSTTTGPTATTNPGISADNAVYPTYVSANALTSSPYNGRYNWMDYSSWVPAGPDNESDSTANVYWGGLEGWVANGDYRLIQPIVKWENPNGTCGVYGWGAYIFAEYDFENVGDVQTCPVLVSAYDWVEGTLGIVSNDCCGDGDEWGIQIQDTSNSDIEPQVLEVWTGSANPALSYALLAVLEPHNLSACAGLSTDRDVYFYLNTLDQEGSTWNTFDNVQPDVTVVTHWGGYTPACSYGAGAYWESTYWLSYVSWAD